ncbi:MAG: outer membrane lipoprotein-sorting protein [Salinisphaeraceae bacterium]|nr:outer membrane lipoprotein-sorting protein [Salinisphaeraceae bacterium]
MAAVSADEAAKLGNELSPVGADPKANADGTIPALIGEKAFTERQKNYTPDSLEEVRQQIIAYAKKNPDMNLITNLDDIQQAAKEDEQFRDLVAQIGADNLKPRMTITADNYKEHADKLTEGHKKLFELNSDYKMIVYPTVRPAYYPDEIYAATKENATKVTLEGTDDISGHELGFPFPIPKTGAEVIWNHKLKFRGSAVKRFNDQAIVDADGGTEITKVVEDVGFEYANLNKASGERNNEIIAYFLQETVAPPRVAGQFTLVHEIFGKGTSGRNAWIFNPGLGRVNRAPDVGYDNPSIGSDGLQFNDQINMFNGALDRYTWKLVGKKEMYIPYNSYMMNNPLAKYDDDITQKGHINQGMARYELHRVWVVEATLRDGTRHQFGKRRFYVDEDSWGIVAVDNYDTRGELWRFQEGHVLTAPFVPTSTTAPEVIYDLKSGRYFVTAMSNEGKIPDFRIEYKDGYFGPNALKRKARLK